jgi:anthranilate synthase/aminodeoxychorismate synthase-like glutamine amidotransferase
MSSNKKPPKRTRAIQASVATPRLTAAAPAKKSQSTGPSVLLLDNYDSFTYNLAQYLGELGCNVEVHRNDKISVEQIARHKPDRIVISPGPCTPREAGISVELIEQLAGKFPILGVCLGHQAIGAAFGGVIKRAPALFHGKTSAIHHDGKGVFQKLADPFTATRYHSLIVERKTLPRELTITAETEDGVIMGLRHKRYKLEGVQFHPESVLTESGKQLLKNFLEM